MGYKLIVSKDAHGDIMGIAAYISHELKSPQAADGFLCDVEESYKRAADNPHIFSLCGDERLERMGYRKIIIKNYLILFRVDEEKKAVYIVRIVYGGRNYPEML
jgi:plasmid stabilization system protein ParE